MKICKLAKGRERTCAPAVILFPLVVTFLFLMALQRVSAQSSGFSFTQISESEPDIISPGRGAEQWHNGLGSISHPASNNSQQSLDVYYRFTWNRIEGPGMGEYRWDYFDGLVRNAVNRGQKLSFGIMTCYPSGSNSPGVVQYDNGDAAYPEYLHQMMQQESYPDWKTDGRGATDGYGTWVPNWNSHSYLERLRALHEALYAHINSSYYTAQTGPHTGKTIAYRDVIFSIDIRGYGSWGEWHSGSIIDHIWNYPEGRAPTTVTLKTIIDYHADVFTDHPLSLMISVFDGERLSNTYTPKEVGAYALERTNNWGPFGWRRDNWGATDDYLDIYLSGNLNFFGNSGPFNALIMDRWKRAPITGEPPGWAASLYGGCYFDDMERQIREYHATSVGNGNYGGFDLDDCAMENLRAAFKASGYRIILEGGNTNGNVKAGGDLAISLDWKNIGIAPTYEKWDVVFELKDENNTVAWSGTSNFSPGPKNGNLALLPSSVSTQITDHFTLPASIVEGDYQLAVVVRDPLGYRTPLPLAIYGRQDDGSYLLKNIFISAADAETEVPVPPVPAPAPAPPVGECPGIEATIINTGGCDGNPVALSLSSATGTGPYEIVVNGITYHQVQTGTTFTTITGESIWSADAPPAVTDIDRPVELGMKFMSSTPGLIKGIRFFSANEISGTYTGSLWSADGTLLANAIFQNVTANGWQEVLFSEPVLISAGTVYIASYYTSAGVYAATSGGLATAVSNGRSLTALGGDVEGGNGVYIYGESAFPRYSYNTSNYWVDVLFSQYAAAFEFTSITDANGCTTNGNLQTLVVAPTPCEQQRTTTSGMVAKSASVVSVQHEPATFADELRQNYPNPFGAETIISYTLAKPGNINLRLFDMNGKLVKILATGSKDAGSHSVSLQAGNLAAGIYYYQLQTGNYTAVKKMVVQ